ncbi:hypothetical protein SDC9_185183 [bioreactor metagenome]|uniref:Uncharacterized protein n=1 Tax=bioreactor metagenome TaxID=1076179 RepID=A0A645HQM5_9ZZZZ
MGSVSGDLSFDRILLRGGNSHPFEFDEIKIGTSWESVLPVSNGVSTTRPAIQSSQHANGNGYGFSFQGSPGSSYSILTTSNLFPANWETIYRGTFGFDAVRFSEPIPADRPQRFYRVEIP